MPDLIPEEVQRFLIDQIDSIAELEVLLIFREHREQSWPCGMVADRIYVTEEIAAGLLVNLAKRGFLTADEMTPTSFRYAPSSQEIARLLDQLAEVYAKYLVPVTELVHKKSHRNIQGIAEAFKFNQEK